MTSIADTIRALLTQQPSAPTFRMALVWCAGILVVAYTVAMVTYRRRIAR